MALCQGACKKSHHKPLTNGFCTLLMGPSWRHPMTRCLDANWPLVGYLALFESDCSVHPTFLDASPVSACPPNHRHQAEYRVGMAILTLTPMTGSSALSSEPWLSIDPIRNSTASCIDSSQLDPVEPRSGLRGQNKTPGAVALRLINAGCRKKEIRGGVCSIAFLLCIVFAPMAVTADATCHRMDGVSHC